MSRQEKIKQKQIQKQINKLIADYQTIKFILDNRDETNEVYFASVDGFLIPVKKEIVTNYLENKCHQIEKVLGIKVNDDGEKEDDENKEDGEVVK